MRQLLLWLLWLQVLVGIGIVAQGWFGARAIRRTMMLLGLVVSGCAVALLLDHEGSAWRWPARAFIVAVTIAVVFAIARSSSLRHKLRWVLVGGIGTIGGLVVMYWLSPNQMSPVMRAPIVAFVAGMAVLFVVSMVRATMAATASRSDA